MAKKDEIKALLGKAEEAPGCSGLDVLGLESCLLPPLRYAPTSEVSTATRAAIVDAIDS